MVNRKRITILDERYTLSVMSLLAEKNSVICDDIQKVVSSARTREKLLGSMRDEGLVSISTVYKPRKTYHVTLTEKGREIAVLLRRAERILAGEAPDPEGPPTNHSAPTKQGNKIG